MECLKFLPRFFMIVSSSILLVAGAAGLVAGVWMKVSPSSVPILGGQIADVQLEQFLSYLLMAAGPALVLVGLLGCCAAVKDSRCLRLLFSVAALTAIVAQAAGVAFVLLFPEELADLLGPRAVELIEEDMFLTLSVIGGVTALEVLSVASAVTLCCISKRRNSLKSNL